MGRFKTWIDRVTSARRRQRSGNLGAARRRSLRFEHFESRLALSAAAATEPSLAPIDVVRDRGEFLLTLWDATPGSAQWGDVSFAVPQNSRLMAAEWANSPTVRARLETFNIDALRYSLPGEGGFVTSDSLMQFATTASAAVDRSAPFDGGALNGNAFDLIGHVLDSVDVSGAFVDSAPSSLDPSWSGGNHSPFDSGEGLSSAGADGGVSGTDEANVTLIESPVLRITAPLPNSSDEGGSIDVTAMVAPRALFAAQHATALANSGERTKTGTVSDAESTAQRSRALAADADELRARAVVYEVSLAREVSDESAAETRAERTPATPNAPSTPVAPPQADAPAATPVVGDVNGEIAADDAMPKAAEGDPATSHQTSSLEQHGAEELAAVAARDAALARFGDDSSELPAADLETASRNQTLGMVLAAVVGAGPLVRRIRRSRATRVAEQAAGLN
jgi:hypothetical protein